MRIVVLYIFTQLRSIAIVIASLIGKYVHTTTPEVADAAAAVFVSGIILITLVPLLVGLCKNCKELWIIRTEERSETNVAHLHPSESSFV